MIFEYIKFNNYRPYYGKQTLSFKNKNKSPNTVYKNNVVLIGGLNGHGKTSLINSIFLALFGHRKFKNQKEYQEYISKSVNQRHIQEGGNEGSIELGFSDETGTYAIEVTFVNNHYEEFRKIYQLDNNFNKSREIQLSNEEFYDFIDARIPLDVAQFFIFDAEKIRDLVGDQETEETIKAIQKVVSLELYNQLLKDIDKVYNDFTKEIKLNVNDKEIDKLFSNLESITDKIESLEQESQTIAEQLEKLGNQEQTKQRERRIIIGSTSLTKQNLSKAIGENTQKLNQIELGLKSAKSNQLQMLILQPYIKKLKERIKKERNFLDAKIRENAKFAPYEDFINELLNIPTSPQLNEDQIKQLKRYGKAIWGKINKIQSAVVNEKLDILHDLSLGDYQKLIYYPETKSSNLKEQISEKQKIEALLRNYQEKFKVAPEEVNTSVLDKEIAELNQQLGELRGNKRNIFNSLNKLRNEKFQLNNTIKSKQRDLEKLGPLEAKLDLLERLRNGTKEFIDSVTILKAKQLKNEIEKIIQQLFRKNEFQRVEFHPEKFTLTIYNQLGNPIDLMSRSEGEKQLIALAMIWALTKVSGANFPFVIDTPLARLDSIHRSNLVNHYFTKLSDQVIILSTDTEITQDFYHELLPFIEREYVLEFDEDTKCTNIVEGYFFSKEVSTWQV
ncbi:DNA sulfur modification protein DndD [Cytobacillus firmus]|uniref:DNA sulfur modification protein DndD n=1 Tax=Cytobacillus firmus TaxID=1399 RepID=UPI00207A3CA6|nr:DNA sulfur modification protein DndD [Cytobacillus firmus]USK37131.1 DNA sulfur modification protein DndD [Cytobacillus firmus]